MIRDDKIFFKVFASFNLYETNIKSTFYNVCIYTDIKQVYNLENHWFIVNVFISGLIVFINTICFSTIPQWKK